MLAKCVADNHHDWNQCRPQVVFCYNASVHESTQFTPFFLVHGTEPRWDIDLRMDSDDRPTYSTNEYADLLLRRLEGAHELTREHLQANATRMQNWYDKKVCTQEFLPGDEVYVLNLRLYQKRCPKWLRRYSDTATVIKKSIRLHISFVEMLGDRACR